MRDYYKEAKTILDNHRLYYLKLNITLPKESLKEVLAVYNQKFFVKHRGWNHKGWLSAALHSVNGDFWKTMSGKQYGYENDSDESIKWNWTDVCDYAPKTTEFFEEFFEGIFVDFLLKKSFENSEKIGKFGFLFVN